MKKIFFAILLFITLFLTVSCRPEEPVSPPEQTEKPGLPSGFTEGMPVPQPLPGVYGGEISVTVSAPAGAVVRYTLDCTEPTSASPALDTPLTLGIGGDAAENGGVTVRVLRLAAFDANGEKLGQTVTASYLFPLEEDRFSTGVVSLVAEPDDLYSYERGILVEGEQADLYREGKSVIAANYNAKGREWERPASFSLYSADGQMEFSQNVGIRLNGTGSRKEAQKNFRIFARKEYSPATGKMKYPFFEGLTSGITGDRINEFDTLLLRGGASNVGNTLFTNAAAYELLQDCDALTTARCRPVSVFLNGSYYGLMTITEDYSPDYFESYYGVDAEDVTTANMTVVQNAESPYLGWEHDDGTEADFREFKRVLEFLRGADFTDPKKYEIACTYLDIDNFIQYVTAECYLNNWDWPRNNIRVWRYAGNGYQPDEDPGFDGRWRFVIKDMDITMNTLVNESLGYSSDIGTDFFQVLEKDGGAPQLIDGIFRHLLQNGDFRQRFTEYLRLFANSIGEPSNLLDAISRYQAVVAKEAGYHLSYYADAYGESAYDWDLSVERMRVFAEQRQTTVLPQIEERTGVDYTAVAVRGAEGGRLLIDGLPLRKEGQDYYTVPGYSHVCTAVPDPGWRFVGITVNGKLEKTGDASFTVREKRGELTPVFEWTGEETSAIPEKNGYRVTPDPTVLHAVVADGVFYPDGTLERNEAGEMLIGMDDVRRLLGDHECASRYVGRVGSLLKDKKVTFTEFIRIFSLYGRVIYVPDADTYLISCAE